MKLSEIEDVDGSDYINANFVNGYKDRKRWICAQGPLDHTVADFWRMVYEQGGRQRWLRQLLIFEFDTVQSKVQGAGPVGVQCAVGK